ncbi:phosphodiester glycosidase family protein [Nocardioides sp. GXQ0305]|uniref:phosphodiester glycosidase family protein n=1 Tax=Nocardioides sp. GXQ0305 TaxID=3423912 RepID=UPI003D7DBAB8
MRTRTGLALVALALVATSVGLLPDDPAPRSPDARGELAAGEEDQPRQTSDGLPGEIAEDLLPGVSPRVQTSRARSWRIAPGVRYRRFEQSDRRGRYRVHVVSVRPSVRGVRLDYASLAKVPRRGRLTRLLRRDDAVAGVNGGFFDIDDTGAPLGVGRDRQRGFLHAAKYTWKNAFTTSRTGGLRIGPVTMRAGIEEHPEIEVTNVNSPRVREGKVGLYTRDWGSTSGYSITDGQRRRVRAVHVEDGRVVSRSSRLTSGEAITGSVLVGRGPGADQLAELRVGSKATVTASIPDRFTFAISGETVLLRHGRIAARDDVYLHPRTAVGIDRDSDRVLLVAVDGRQSFSRGLTLVELARLMRRLGAEAALNLDGGGSTTVAGLGRGRKALRVLNSPSDGSQRPIPDGIAVLAR